MTSADSGTIRLGVEGLGLVGLRVARQAVAEAEIGSVVLLGGSEKRRQEIFSAFGSPVDISDDAAESTLDIVVVAGVDADHVESARDHLARGRSVVSTAEAPRTVDQLRELGDSVADQGQFVIVGAGFCPGMSTLLARHAADALDSVEEINVAVAGTAGMSCAARRAEALRRDGVEWRDGEWLEVSARSGPERLWFPDPIGAVECVRAESSEPALVAAAVEAAGRISARVGEVSRRRRLSETLRAWRRTRSIDEPGGLRVEVQGTSGPEAATLLYGVMDRPSIVSAAVAVTSALEARRRAVTGGCGVAEIGPAVDLLGILRSQGVRASVFEGVG